MNPRVIANLYSKHSNRSGFREKAEKFRETRKAVQAARREPRQSEAIASPLPMPYFLQVETQVTRRDLPFLYTSGPELVGLIEGSEHLENGRLRLEHSSWEVTEDRVHLFNYWNMGMDADGLTYAELRLPDTPGYARFERLIVDEVKDIVVPVSIARRDPKPLVQELRNERRGPPKPLENQRFVYARVCYSVRARDLAEFAARLEASLLPFAENYGWYDGQAFIGITGHSGRIIQNWIVPESGVRLAEHRLASADWHALLPDRPTCRFLEPTPTDPILGRNMLRSSADPLTLSALEAAE